MEANVDDKKLVELVQGSAELLKNIFRLATDDWEVQLAALKLAVEKKDYSEIRAKIHRLNGGIRTFYATDLVTGLSQWEKAAAAQEDRDWSKFVSHVEVRLNELRSNVKQVISQLETN